MDTGDKKTAESVLPILAEWVSRAGDRHLRHGIYSRFLTPHALPYLDRIVEWLTTEEFDLARETLTQVLVRIAKAADAERLWRVCHELPRQPSYYALVSKLAGFPAVQREARDEIIEALRTENLRAGDLQDISAVNDPRIREWFKGQLASRDRFIRQIAKRVVQRGERLPPELQYAPSSPDRSTEAFSVEIDVQEYGSALRGVAKSLGFKVPAGIRKSGWIASVEVDRWMVAPVATEHGNTLTLWLRLEDIDTIEFVVTGAGAAGIGGQ